MGIFTDISQFRLVNYERTSGSKKQLLKRLLSMWQRIWVTDTEKWNVRKMIRIEYCVIYCICAFVVLLRSSICPAKGLFCPAPMVGDILILFGVDFQDQVCSERIELWIILLKVILICIWQQTMCIIYFGSRIRSISFSARTFASGRKYSFNLVVFVRHSFSFHLESSRQSIGIL